MNASEHPRTIAAGGRILRVLKALKGHSLTGLSNSELARSVDDSPSNVTRALHTLIDEGLAIQLPNGRYAHSVQMLLIARAHYEHVAQAQARIDELRQRLG